MRPHVLELRAFGPFAGDERVDFDDLGAAGLVLLHGDTGAGKTSVLDALGFALYGEVPGERGVRGLRSEHADPAVETVVRLEFTAGGRRWRIRRTPRQHVAKQRGGGLTLRQPSALLEELVADDEWRAVATRLDEVGMTIRDAVGLTGQQFFQVVLLPQGRFAAFLHAPADQRQALLQQLFGTERFTDIERALKERRALLADRVGSAHQAMTAQVDLVRSVGRAEPAVACAEPYAGPVDADGAGPAGSPADRAGWASGVLVALTSRLEEAEGAVEVAEAAEVAAADALLDTQALASRQQRLAAATADHARLVARGPAVDAARAALVAARAASPIGPTLDRLDARSGEHARVTAGVREVAARLLPEVAADAGDEQIDLFTSPTLTAGSGLPELADVVAEERRLRDEAAALRPLLAAEAELDQRRLAARDLAAARERADEEVEAAQREVADAEAAAVAAAATATDAEQLAARGHELADVARLAAARATAAEELVPARERAAGAAAAYDDARAAALDARERWLEVARARLAGMAAELARQLRDGEPCQVCGAVEHPAPAPTPDDAVTEDDERRAHRRADRADASVEPLRRAAQSAAERVAVLEAALGCGPAAVPDAAAVRATSTAAAEAAAQAEAAERRLPAARAEAGRRAELVARAGARLERAKSAAADAAARLATAAAAVAERAAMVDDARGEAASVAERIGAIEATAREVGELAALLREERALAADVADLDAELAEAVRAAGFPDVAAVRAARRGDDEIAALDAEVRQYDDEVAGVEARLADPDLQVALDPPADVATARSVAVAAKAAVTAAVAARAALEHRCAQARTAVARIVELEREMRPALTRLHEVQALAELAAGGAGNRFRMSLTSFVLAARLEAVAARASARLSRMTSGRFTLVHTDEVVDGRQRSGLGLAVRDVWTGTERPTSSLSGGETFMTALSLALGLADVVAEEAGGRTIETLFVDEGFGTLDERALDRVMEVLDGLRDGGRLVGLVSHVAELQRRVPGRLEVVRSEGGSRLRPHPVPAYD